MTQPVTHGFPDFNQQLLTSDVLQVFDDNVTADSFDKPIKYIGNAQYIAVRADAFVKNWGMTWNWWADPAGAQFLAGVSINMLEGDFFSQSMPVYGPYVEILGSSNVAGGRYRCKVWTAGGMFVPVSALDIVLVSSLVNTPANGSTQVDTSRVGAYPAVLSAHSGLANWGVRVQAITKAGTTSEIAAVFNNTEPHTIMIPPDHIRVFTDNFTGAADNIQVNLVAKPWVG